MSDLCDFCKKEKDEVYFKEIIYPDGETVNVFLCVDCYNKKADDIELKEKHKGKKNDLNVNLIYKEIKSISDKLSQIITLLDEE